MNTLPADAEKRAKDFVGSIETKRRDEILTELHEADAIGKFETTFQAITRGGDEEETKFAYYLIGQDWPQVPPGAVLTARQNELARAERDHRVAETAETKAKEAKEEAAKRVAAAKKLVTQAESDEKELEKEREKARAKVEPATSTHATHTGTHAQHADSAKR